MGTDGSTAERQRVANHTQTFTLHALEFSSVPEWRSRADGCRQLADTCFCKHPGIGLRIASREDSMARLAAGAARRRECVAEQPVPDDRLAGWDRNSRIARLMMRDVSHE